MTWARWFERSNRRVDSTEVGQYRVSTVFLGLDHSFGGPAPLLFETMIFPLESMSEEFCQRYATWEEAVAGHQEAVERAKGFQIR